MGLFTPASGLIERRSERLMMRNYDLYVGSELTVNFGKSAALAEIVCVIKWNKRERDLLLIGLLILCVFHLLA